jgi:hypothetical protein
MTSSGNRINLASGDQAISSPIATHAALLHCHTNFAVPANDPLIAEAFYLLQESSIFSQLVF